MPEATRPAKLDRVPAPVPSPPKPAPRPPSHRRRAVLAAGAVLAAVLLWWGSGYVFAYTDDAYVDSDVVSVAPQVAGPVETVAVSDNQQVRRGALLFTIDPTPFQLQLQQAVARQAEAEAQLPIDQANLDSLKAEQQAVDDAAGLANATLNRVAPLATSNDVPRQTYDNARSAQAQGVAKQFGARAAVLRAEQTLRLHQVAVATADAARLYARWKLDCTRVVATVDGTVTNLSLSPGDQVAPDHAALAIVDAGAWRVFANYKEYYLRHLRPGHTAWIWLDTNPWHLYRARVQGLAHGISREQGGSALVPYVSPTVDWIRLDRRIPVRLQFLDPPPPDELFRGADARVISFY